MPRTIIAPPDFSGAALAALKEWLAITTPREDALLTGLLGSAHDTCERFTGLLPLASTIAEVIAPAAGWLALATRPVLGVSAAALLDPDGAAAPIGPERWEVALDADGGARLRLADPAPAARLRVTFTAGLAGDWSSLPPALGEGIVRLAAHAYRSRDGGGSEPPAAITALWRAWRRLRL